MPILGVSVGHAARMDAGRAAHARVADHSLVVRQHHLDTKPLVLGSRVLRRRRIGRAMYERRGCSHRLATLRAKDTAARIKVSVEAGYELVVKILLFGKWQNADDPAFGVALRRGVGTFGPAADTDGKNFVRGHIVMDAQPELFEIVGALHASGRLASSLHGR